MTQYSGTILSHYYIEKIMGELYNQYQICKQRGHQKSRLKDGIWEICLFCEARFRWVTEPQEKDAPSKDE